MTTTTNVTNTNTTATTASTSTTATARTSLATNFQTFLTLLTTQLQNQDPTSPMDSNQFTQQLVMYSQVEQQLSTNDKLDSLISLGTNQSTNLAMSYLGKSVVLSDGSGQLADSAASWTYGLANDASATTLTATNRRPASMRAKASRKASSSASRPTMRVVTPSMPRLVACAAPGATRRTR